MPLPPRDSDSLPPAVAWLIAVVVMIGCLLVTRCTAPVQAQDAAVDVDEQLAVALARVCVHESGFRSPADCALIWQATRGHGDTSAARLAWLGLHSPRALTGPHWSAHLPASGVGPDAPPSGWPPQVLWSTYAPRWSALLVATRSLVLEDRAPRVGWPCSTTPQTWGGRVVDAAHVARHADVYHALHCVDPVTGSPTRNEGYRYRRPR